MPLPPYRLVIVVRSKLKVAAFCATPVIVDLVITRFGRAKSQTAAAWSARYFVACFISSLPSSSLVAWSAAVYSWANFGSL